MNDIRRTPSTILFVGLLAACGGKQTVPDDPTTNLRCPDGATFEPGETDELGSCMRDGKRNGPAVEQAADYGDDVIGVGSYVDDQREGLWVFMAGDEQVAAGMYVADSRHGEWTFGQRDTPTATGTYALGEPQGEWTFACRQGTCIGSYLDGTQQSWRWTNGQGSRRVFFDGGLWRRETLDANGGVLSMHVIEDPRDNATWTPDQKVDTPAAWLGLRPYACAGPFREYYDEGKTARLGNCDNGELDGTVRTYAPTGGLVDESNYVRGVRHGSQRSLWPDGSVRRLEHRSKGKLDGAVAEHTEGGVQIVSGEYAGDRPTGTWLLRWPNGQKRAEGTFVAADAVATCKEEPDADEAACDALLGKATGTWRYWHPTGKRAAIVTPEADRFAVKYFDEAGKSTTPSGKNGSKAVGGGVRAAIEAGGQVKPCLEQRPTGWPFWQMGEVVVTYDLSDPTTSMTADVNRLHSSVIACLADVKPPSDAEKYVVTITFGERHPGDPAE